MASKVHMMPPSCLNYKQTCTSLLMTRATTVAQHAVLGIATTRVSCKANTCFDASIVTIQDINQILAPTKLLLNTLAELFFGYTHYDAKPHTLWVHLLYFQAAFPLKVAANLRLPRSRRLHTACTGGPRHFRAQFDRKSRRNHRRSSVYTSCSGAVC